MLEKWVILSSFNFVQDKFTMLKEEKWDIGLLGVFFLTHKVLMFKKEKLLFKTNIPTFHYSMYEVKTPSLNKSL